MYRACAAYTLHAAYVGGLSSELIRCVICMGWKRGCSQNMWEIHLWPWISLSCCCTWQVVTCGLILFWRMSQEVESERTIWSNRQWCIKLRNVSWNYKRWLLWCFSVKNSKCTSSFWVCLDFYIPRYKITQNQILSPSPIYCIAVFYKVLNSEWIAFTVNTKQMWFHSAVKFWVNVLTLI